METGGCELMNLWHTLDIPELLDRLNASDKGLEPEEVTSRQQQYGPNEIKGKAGVTALELLAGQFKNFLILLLLFAALVSIGIAIWEHSVQEMIEGGLIALIVVFIVGVGFYQEYHAEKELDALRGMADSCPRVGSWRHHPPGSGRSGGS
jgi:Ca2+-transporting ATPase